jgi:hypothetical protein
MNRLLLSSNSFDNSEKAFIKMKGQSSIARKDDSCKLEAEHRDRANMIQRLVLNLTESRTSSAAACKRIVSSTLYEHH